MERKKRCEVVQIKIYVPEQVLHEERLITYEKIEQELSVFAASSLCETCLAMLSRRETDDVQENGVIISGTNLKKIYAVRKFLKENYPDYHYLINHRKRR